MMKIIVALGMLATATAVCPNSCSGHGTCTADDVCVCYDNFMSGDGETGDCSDRQCPFGATWAGAPSADGTVHGYQECSGKGICDRSSGQCECFEGYTGKGCARQTCPNDCSGHGTCEYVEELGVAQADHGVESYGFHDGSTDFEAATLASTWDAHKSRACVCDAQYTDVDCSRRMCNKGNDIMDTRDDITDATAYQIQTVNVLGACGATGDGTTACVEATDFPTNSDFALTFTSRLGEKFTTGPIAITNDGTNVNYATLSAAIESALEALPNGVIDDVAVADATYATGALTFTVEFTGAAVSGTQNQLVVAGDACGAGCAPMLTGIITASHTTTGTGVTSTTAADYNSYECGRRGKCDYDSGVCECFEGFKGEACGSQTALV